ncbi:MAG: RNA ligase family protein [Nevskia sp.]|nr:RNA ligase family protein [Nevskia sp.]
MTDFFRFPHTPHLSWLGSGEPRDDKVLSPNEASTVLAGEVVVEEKLDGANLGVSINEAGSLRAQNRGQYLQPPFIGQFSRLASWLATHEDRIVAALTPNLIAFGEWCAARHSLDYVSLPDWWLLFDIYDRQTDRFWSTARRDDWARKTGVTTVSRIDREKFDLVALKRLLDRSPSRYREGPMEGIVIRAEQGDWLKERAKLVRANFTQSIEVHWRKRPLQWNRLKS